MLEEHTIDSRTVIIVSGGQDPSLLECGATLRSCGAAVRLVPDVYAAMAQLAGGLASRNVVVDIRTLDDHEMSFLNLAPRYYAKLQILVPLLDGTAQRTAAREGRWKTLPVSDLTDSLLGIRSAVTADYDDGTEVIEWADEDEPGVSDEPRSVHEARPEFEFRSAPADSLSTDGGQEAAMDGPSLHEAVRRRMADSATGEKSIRRRPPGSDPAQRAENAMPTESTADDDMTLSAEEMDALLRDGDEGIVS